jgi:hypothetical protein
MARKLVLKIAPSPLVLSVSQLVSARQDGQWPATWRALGESLDATAKIVQAETDSLIETLTAMDRADGVAIVFGDDAHKQGSILSVLGLGTVIVTVDLATLTADAEHGVDASRILYKLLARLAEDPHFHCVLRLGTQNVDDHAARECLQSYANERGFLLDARLLRDSFDPSDVFDDDLGEDQSMRRDGELTDTERDFLDEAGVGWPISAVTLDRVWRELAFAAHPDRHPGNLHAEQRFVRLKSAYDSLRTRLLAPVE